MISEVLKAFQKKGGGELLWYIRLRAFTGFGCLVAIVIYFAILLIQLSNKEIYLVIGQTSIGEKGYNGSIPFPDSLEVSTSYFSSQNSNITCYLSTLTDIHHEYPGCVGILESAAIDGDFIVYKPVLENLIWFSDFEKCALGQSCPSVFFFEIRFAFPPVDLMNITYASPDIQVMVSNRFVWPNDYDKSDPVMATIYNLNYGDIYSVNFDWTKYYPVSRNPYYINTQQSSKMSVGSNYTNAAMTFSYRTETIATNTERYIISISDILGLVGGLYSGMATVFALLFGMGAVTPWGILPKYFFRPYIVEPLREEYSVVNAVNEESCPLGDPLPMDGVVNPENFAYLQARVAKLESLLARFYLDADLLSTPPAVILTEKSSYNRTEQ